MRASCAADRPAGTSFPRERDAEAAGRSPRASGVPVRPSLPCTLGALGGAWGAVLAVDAALVVQRTGERWAGLDPRAALVCALAGAFALCALAAVLVPRMRPVCALAAAGAVAGALSGALALGATLSQGDGLLSRAVSAWSFRVETDPQESSTGRWHFEADVLDADGRWAGRVWVDVAASAALDDEGAPALPPMGAVVGLVGTWEGLDLADEFDASLAKRGVATRVSAVRCAETGFQEGLVGAVRALRGRLVGALDPYSGEARALTAGVVCGMQAALAGFEASDDFADLGLSHLVAVSGSHLAVFAALVAALARRSHTRPAARLAVTGTLLALYVVFTGLQPSAVRSWVMAVLALGAAVAGRRAHAASAVAVAALAMLLVQPSCAANMGFTLSVLSVVGLTVFAGIAGAWARALLPARLPGQVSEPLALTTVAQAFTLPVTLPAFGTLAVLSPLANVVAGPLVSALLVAGLACVPLAAALPWTGALLLPCDLLAGATCRLAALMAAAPVAVLTVDAQGPSLFCLLGAVCAAVYLVWPAPSRRVAACVLGAALLVGGCLYVSWRLFAPARIVVLDVGQGDAILVQDGAGALLVDTGPDDAVCYALAREHVVHLDAVLLTHTDADHAGGLDDLAGRVPVDCVVVAEGVARAVGDEDADLWAAMGEVAGGDVREVSAGDVLTVGGFELEVVWPRSPVAGDENEDSVVAVARWGADGSGRRMSVLLTGDAEDSVVGPLAASGAVGQVDVLKVAHHGSAASTSQATLTILDPAVAVASAGEGNRYGHPTEECVSTLEASGALFLCTAGCGDVELRPARDGVEVSCARARAG